VPSLRTRRERKVVTVVFCDLVGFASRAEALDPEDVEAFLSPYHERVRSELERHGGTVEKFIGDAVMALFGAPTAHEDDPERAIRASLAIRDWAREEEAVQVRIAVTTGEALVRLDARPEAGEGMAAGDVVNTAARLQSAAPVNGILADETTYRATRRAIDFDEAAPVEAKGKAEPIPVWEVTAAHARFGVDTAHGARSELVGRERELGVVKDAFERARHERTPQLLTLVGVPGIGKSRLVYELSRIVDADPELITWRQGRCLAYGDGVTMWALGEIVKAQAGVLEQDTPAGVAEKLRRAAAEALPQPDVAWVESHLLALVGLGVESDLGGDHRNESFSAWRRFLEGLAEQRPIVVVFEDLHWADDSLLDFVDELVDWLTDVPLLVVATARPELLERRPGWGGGKLNATTLALAPLSDEQTARLLSGLLGSPVFEADTQKALIERAGGNPLYAEQFAELYVERGSSDELPLPETLQGIIAARLDGLGTDEKGLLLDAAVVGKVFWTNALGRNETETSAAFHSLERKGFVRRQRRSSVEGQTELAFAHALVRDVAYGQIPRADRVAKHRRVAEWIESLGRPEDHAEMLAYHWSSALELARAAGGADDELAERACTAWHAAGDRAFGLNAFTSAATHYRSALALSSMDDAARPQLLFKFGRALFLAGNEEAGEALEEARDALVEADDRDTAAECEAFLARIAWFRGEQSQVFRHLDAAEALIAGAEPSPSVARVLGWSGRQLMLAGEYERGRERAKHALSIAEDLQLVDLRVHALTTIGSAKEFLGDTTGREDLERAVEIGRAASSPMVPGALNNLSVVMDLTDMLRVEQLRDEALRDAERFGDVPLIRFLDGNGIGSYWILGDWDEALATADRFIAECQESPHVLEASSRQFRGYIRLARGRREEALEDFELALALARETPSNAQDMAPALIRSAWAYLQVGRIADARTAFDEAMQFLRKDPHARPWTMPEVAVDLDEGSAAREILELLPPSIGRSAMLALVDGRFSDAAEHYGKANIRLFEAEARLRAAEQLFAGGDPEAGKIELEKALVFYRSVDAVLFVERGERLLAEAQSASA
jgi:class 3 adenylate cyclase/tetratricopeptide (TPR) repeat protein